MVSCVLQGTAFLTMPVDAMQWWLHMWWGKPIALTAADLQYHWPVVIMCLWYQVRYHQHLPTSLWLFKDLLIPLMHVQPLWYLPYPQLTLMRVITTISIKQCQQTKEVF